MIRLNMILLLFLCFSATRAQESGDVQSVSEFRKELNASFRNPETSPLKPEDRKDFKGLDFFEADTSFRIEAEFLRTPFETPFAMPTTTGRLPIYVKYGEAYFNYNGREYKLNLYQNQHLLADPEYHDYLFLPFTDRTNGNTTYAGGRYVDMRIPAEGSDRIIIDFNKAYNPYCVYNGEYSCPIPPEENHLDFPVTAGVKNFRK